MSKGKNEVALKNLNRIRSKRLAENGTTAAEIRALDEAVESSNMQSGSWLDLFRGTYLRRTVVTSLLFWASLTAAPSITIHQKSPTINL